MSQDLNDNFYVVELQKLRARAQAGDSEAMTKIYQFYAIDKDGTHNLEAINWLLEAAKREFKEAQFELGLLYESGDGIEQSDKIAADWYHKAAAQGHSLAQYNLGYFYESGRGIVQDYVKAAFWYHQAAAQGLAEAQNNLGVLYSQGKGVEQSSILATEWYQKADMGTRLTPPWKNWVGSHIGDKLSVRPNNKTD